MVDLPAPSDAVIAELDAAVQAHLDWTRRLLRCAVLRTPPDDDVLDPAAHTLCRFGAWFERSRDDLGLLDGAASARIDHAHRAMHDAMRSICSRILAGEAGQAEDLERFEHAQAALVDLLAGFKTTLLSNAARRDPLTGLPLRHGIEHDFARHQQETRRTRGQLYLVMIDVDNLEPVNDLRGRAVGDAVLRQVAETLRHALRSDEALCRYGGDEFLWLLKCRAPEEARQSARRVLAAVGTTPVLAGDEILRVTITLGLALAGETDGLASVLARAQDALRDGKRLGRNRYTLADG